MTAKLDFLKSDNFKLTKRLDLGEFNEALTGQTLSVWLNLDKQWWADWARQSVMSQENQAWVDAENERLADLPESEQEAAYNAFVLQIKARQADLLELATSIRGRLWGCSPEEARQLYEISAPLYTWASNRAIELVQEYQDQRKKAPNRT